MSDFTRPLFTPLMAMLAATVTATAPAQAQQRNFIALGAISVPEFEGADDNAVAPFIIGRLDLGDAGALRIAGTGLQYNLIGGRSAWALGPLLSYRPKRDGSVDDPVLRTLREVDAAVEVGAFVEYGWRDALAGGDRLALGLEGKGGKGAQWALTASYMAPRLGGLQFSADARLGFANGRYMDSYFSIDADNSARSGLPQYTATGGAKSGSVGFNLGYDLDGGWMLLGRVGYTRLLGDARDSPIVKLRDSAGSTSAGVAVGYRF